MREIRWFCRKGKSKLQCNDHIYFRENGDYGFYCLTNDRFRIGEAESLCPQVQKSVADAFEEHPEFFFQESLQDIKDMVVEIIREVYYNLTKDCMLKTDFQGGFLLIVVSRKQNSCLWVHCGSGMLVKEDMRGSIEIMSHPAGKNMGAGRSPLPGMRRCMLLSQGAWSCFYRNRELTENGKDFLKKGTKIFGKILDQLEMEEDYSMIEIGL